MIDADPPARRPRVVRRDPPHLRIVWPERADPRPGRPEPARWRRAYVVRSPGSAHALEYRLSREPPPDDPTAQYDPDEGLWLSLRIGRRLE